MESARILALVSRWASGLNGPAAMPKPLREFEAIFPLVGSGNADRGDCIGARDGEITGEIRQASHRPKKPAQQPV